MIASRVTPPNEEEGAKVDVAEGVEGAAVLNHLDRSCTLLRLTVAVSIAPITWKGSEEGKGNKKNGVKTS